MAALCLPPGIARPPPARDLWHAAPPGTDIAILATIGGGLAADAAFGGTGQMLASAWALGTFAWLYRAGGADERAMLLLCLLISLAGEAFLSLAWGLYDYRGGGIPVFVPPGHALLMTLGVRVAQRLPRRVPRVVGGIAGAWAVCGALSGWDSFGALLFALYAACSLFSRARNLYAAMFVLALALELYGTWLGAWAWHSAVPWLALSTTNPPVAAGAFYCALDLLVVAAVSAWTLRVQRPALPSPARPRA